MTSISIIIVAIGLWPLKDLVTDLKVSLDLARVSIRLELTCLRSIFFYQSEEFFRVLDSHNTGVPLRVVNGISNPSFGMEAGFKAMIQRHCSPFLAAAILAGFFTIATTTLAPAACELTKYSSTRKLIADFTKCPVTVQTVLSDSDVQAFAVGACGPQSVFKYALTSMSR